MPQAVLPEVGKSAALIVEPSVQRMSPMWTDWPKLIKVDNKMAKSIENGFMAYWVYNLLQKYKKIMVIRVFVLTKLVLSPASAPTRVGVGN